VITAANNLGNASSPVDSTDDRRAQMYPVLSDAQIAELQRFGREQEFAQGDVLWDVGERGVAFYVVLEGELQIVRRGAFGEDSVLLVHSRGGYSGETALLSGRAAMVAGRAGNNLKALAVPADSLREIMVTHARLGERSASSPPCHGP
jgi:thioredoxin reductase (NADPH)